MSKSKAKIFSHLHNEVYCRLGVSPVHGIGVFAIRSIPKGVNPLKTWLDFREIKFSPAEIKKLPSAVRREIEIFCYYDEESVHIPSIGMNSMNMAFYLNHSKTPSVKYLKNGKMLSLRAIQTGEEIFLDYDEAIGEIHTFE